ncbi:uncharacterized protein EKO05_0011074 [Ascochyta rabiei]|uniref:uncharacterized protein n=1 Tax=Didymella rabiei TaxID=5454 RepID=UPI0021F9B9C5|nr:uncharacterized protein EKO05_0011074 [Ascochyta rabiei]UPX20858.1 hypothetical protein EKO05_0011074 [Ascochyta rabiei]
MSDMALLHHWATVAGCSILNTHDLNHFWHSVIPSIGFKHQHVIHSVLSISALHIAYTNPSDRGHFLLVAGEHRSKALDGFTEDLQNIGPANCNALFANAALTFLYAFISFSHMFEEELTDPKLRTNRTLGGEWIPLVRGTATVLQSVYQYVREGSLSSFLELHNFTDLDPTDDLHASTYNDRLVRTKEIWATDEHAEVYNETLRALLKCSAWMAQFLTVQNSSEASWGYNRFCSGPFIWIFNAPEKYLVLLQQRQPPALIVFAFYGVLLHQLNDFWWAEGCGRSIIGTVDECLGPYWSSWMDWPRQAVGLL